MRTLYRRSVLIGTALAAFGCLQSAYAGCSSTDYSLPGSAWLQQQRIVGPGGLTLAQAAAGLFPHERPSSDRSIVGMWKFTFTSKGSSGIPDGTVVDAGYATWHNDGTELMNSGRSPPSGNFCMGVWKQIGFAAYKLNHIALAWDATGTVFVGPANIRETVTVDGSGNGYTGTFTIDQYADDGVTLLAHVAGTVDATRVTVD